MSTAILKVESPKQRKHAKFNFDLQETPAEVLWKSGGKGLLLKIVSSNFEVSLDLGADVCSKLKQALEWANQ